MDYERLLSTGTVKCGKGVLIFHIRKGGKPITRTADLLEPDEEYAKGCIRLIPGQSAEEKEARFHWTKTGVLDFKQEILRQAGEDVKRGANHTECIYYGMLVKEKSLKVLNAAMVAQSAKRRAPEGESPGSSDAQQDQDRTTQASTSDVGGASACKKLKLPDKT
jgi:hypothetical protein